MILFLLLGLIVPGAVVWTILYGFVGRSKLIAHHSFVSGQIYDARQGVKGSPKACNVKYRYSVEGRQYEGVTLFQPSQLQYEDCMRHLAGHSFPIVYETGNADNSVILLSPGACKLYHFTFPDSLAWVSQYVHEK